MPNPKRHHYLPEFYLDRFTSSEGFLWLFDRSQGKFRREKPKNTTVIGHYYSLTGESGARNSALEQHFSLIEGLARPALDQLESGMELTLRERFRVSLFLGYLFCRVPAFARALNESITGLVEVIARKNLEDAETAGNFDLPPEELLEYLNSGEFLLEANDNMRIAQIVKQGEKIGEKLFSSSEASGLKPTREASATQGGS